MIQIIIATDDRTHFSEFAETLSAEGNASIGWADSDDAVLKLAAEASPHLIVIDENLGKITGLDMARKIIFVNAMVNIAMVSSLSEEDFHETAEGLGILSQLQPYPGKSQAKRLLGELAKVLPVFPG